MTRRRAVLGGVLAFAVLGVAAFAWSLLSGRESTDDARVDGHIFPISAQVGGTVLSVDVEDNQLVESGTVLVRIDDRAYAIAVASAEADLASAEARYREMQTGLPVSSLAAETRASSADAGLARAESGVASALGEQEVARARLETARAREAEAEVNHEKAARDLERMRPLAEKDEISQQQFDGFRAAAAAAEAARASARAAAAEAETAVASAGARVDEARTGVALARSDVKGATAAPHEVAASEARIAAAAAEIDRARTALDQARLDLEHTTIRAPVSGIVSKRNAEPGAVIGPGQPLMALVPLDGLWITANFKETQLESIVPGASAEVRVDTYGGTTFEARVESVAAATGATFSLLAPENASGNFVKVVQRIPVRLVITNPPDETKTLRPGMSVEVTVFTDDGS